MAHKRLILAVAGSGKTRFLIENLNLTERFLLVTFTNTSRNLLDRRIVDKFGYFPNNIKTLTYFEFVYGFCVKPFCLNRFDLRGLFLEPTPGFTNYFPNSDIRKYISSGGYLYHNRIGKFIEFANVIGDVKEKLEKFYDHFFFDECQDLGGHDFNFIENLVQANVNFTFVGDFFQHTYVTSFDGNTNSNLYSDFNSYCKRWEDCNVEIDTTTLKNSYRCSPTICKFVSDNLGISILSNRSDTTHIIEVRDEKQAVAIIQNDAIIKLVYDKSGDRAYFSKNWGDCKGEDDFSDTCIILNKTTAKLFSEGRLMELAGRTKNKLYVALTRTKSNCYLVGEQLVANK